MAACEKHGLPQNYFCTFKGTVLDPLKMSIGGYESLSFLSRSRIKSIGFNINFILGTVDTKKTLHLLNWNILVKSKEIGGLDIQKSSIKIKALLAWRSPSQKIH